MLSFFLIYFTFFASLNGMIPVKWFKCCNIFSKLLNKGKEDSDSGEYIKQRFGTVILTISNLFFTTIFSGFLIFGNEVLKDFTLRYLITLPIALTKFYIFILTNCLLNIIDYGNIDLLSNPIIISVFLSVFHSLTFVITDIIDIEPRILVIIQFSIGILCFLSFVVLLLISNFVEDVLDCLTNSCCKSNSCCDDCCDCCPYDCCDCLSNSYCECSCCDDSFPNDCGGCLKNSCCKCNSCCDNSYDDCCDCCPYDCCGFLKDFFCECNSCCDNCCECSCCDCCPYNCCDCC